MLKKRVLLTALLSLAVILTVAGRVMMQQAEMLREEFHQTYPLGAQGRVSLENINGSVRVVAWDRDEVKVDAVKSAYRRDRLDEAKIVVRSDMNAVHIETDYPMRTQNFNDDEGRYNNPATVEYTLTVPRNVRIDSIELINGDLNIDGITGDIKASSINGHVSGHELMGEVRLSTVNGKVEAMFGRLNETKAISLGSVNGPVTLVIPSDSNAVIKADTVHGGISNDFGLPVRRGEYVGRDLAGQLGQGGARIKLGNVNGAITIKHAPDGRPLSRATSLLADDGKDEGDEDDDATFDVDEAKSEARRTAREAAREARQAQVEARRARVEAQRAQLEAQRAQREAEMEAARAQVEAKREQMEAQAEAKRAQIEAQSEAQQDAASAQAEAQAERREAMAEAGRARAEAAREAQEERRAAQAEAAQIRVEAQRIARETVRIDRVDIEGGNSLRLVERDSKTFAVSGTPQVNLHTFDGYITVHGWDKQEVQLTFNKRAAGEQQMRGIRLRMDQNGSTITVVADFDQNFARHDANVTFTNALVNLEVYVPRSSMMRLSSGDGRLELEGVNGTLELNTGDGRIDVRDARGRLNANTGDGRIQVENFDGDVKAKTGDGRIVLDGKFAGLAAQTGSGSILLTVPSDTNATIETDAESVDNQGLTVTEETGSSKSLKRWKIGQGGRVLTLRTGEGRVFLRSAGLNE
jgi:DUF4097 and DUF4098 domain-containing protein YvlB